MTTRTRVVLYNNADTTKTLELWHPFTLDKCVCAGTANPACTFYFLGRDLQDVCKNLRLDPKLPVFLANSPLKALSVDNTDPLFDPILLIPVHKTTPTWTGLQN